MSFRDFDKFFVSIYLQMNFNSNVAALSKGLDEYLSKS